MLANGRKVRNSVPLPGSESTWKKKEEKGDRFIFYLSPTLKKKGTDLFSIFRQLSLPELDKQGHFPIYSCKSGKNPETPYLIQKAANRPPLLILGTEKGTGYFSLN
jgi:hypothetical protein